MPEGVPKEIKEVVEKLEPLIDGNWANEPMGQLEELSNKIDKIGNLLLFLLAIQVLEDKISLDYLMNNHLDGWKIGR